MIGILRIFQKCVILTGGHIKLGNVLSKRFRIQVFAPKFCLYISFPTTNCEINLYRISICFWREKYFLLPPLAHCVALELSWCALILHWCTSKSVSTLQNQMMVLEVSQSAVYSAFVEHKAILFCKLLFAYMLAFPFITQTSVWLLRFLSMSEPHLYQRMHSAGHQTIQRTILWPVFPRTYRNTRFAVNMCFVLGYSTFDPSTPAVTYRSGLVSTAKYIRLSTIWKNANVTSRSVFLMPTTSGVTQPDLPYFSWPFILSYLSANGDFQSICVYSNSTTLSEFRSNFFLRSV